jgi:hypothetical protein
MSLALVAALALLPTSAHCSWDSPGVNPFMGNVPAAVDRYTDIPADVRERLKSRMNKRDFDEMATIRRDSITGKNRYSAEIRDMHFGQGTVCRTVSRTKWAPEAVERGLVYCEAEHCIIVPTVCRNVSRVKRLPGPGAEAPGGADGLPGGMLVNPGPVALGPDGTARALAADTVGGEAGELVFDPPGAGNPSFSQASQPAADLTSLGGGGTASVPLAATLGGLPALAGTTPDTVGGGSSGGSGLDLPAGVPALGTGAGGGGGVPILIAELPPPFIETPIPVIPEPPIWAMGLAGLACLTWLARRRAQRWSAPG